MSKRAVKERIVRLRVGVLLSLLLAAWANARSEKLPFKNYTTADGLGHDRVEQIVRDSRGFLWFCTGEGLSRFDGYEFKNYTQAQGLPHRRVMDLIETRDGAYLVATYSGLAVFNPLGVPRRWLDIESRQETPPSSNEPPMFRVFRPSDAKPDRRAWTIMDLLEDREGRIWAATLDGLYQIERKGDEWVFRRIETGPWNDKKVFNALHEDRYGGIWIGTGADLYRLLPDGQVQTIPIQFPALSFLGDSQGRVWVGGGLQGKGVAVFTLSEGSQEPVLTRALTKANGLTADTWLHDMLETSDGRILIGTSLGLNEFLPEAAQGNPSFHTISTADVLSLAEDNDGNVWIGTAESGAIKMARRGFTIFDEADFPKSAQSGLLSIFGGEGSELFVSNGTSQLLHFDGEKFSVMTPKGMKTRSWGWNQIDFRSRTGEWWIGNGGEILRYPNVPFEALAETEPLAVYDYASRAGFKATEVFRLFEDSRGDVWIGLTGGVATSGSAAQLLRWERATDTLHLYPPAEYGLPRENGPTAFGEDAAGDIWIGYYFDGLVRYRSDRFEMFTAAEGMPSGIVNAIENDRAGRIWIATGSNGIVRVDNPADDHPRLLNLTKADGLSSNQANCLTEDNLGRIYVGTGHGVTRIDPATGRLKLYAQPDGLPRSFIRICGRDATGAVWFSQNTALARLVPEAEEVSTPPPVFIGSVRVNGEPALKLSELGETSVEHLSFASDQRQVQIDFLALSFSTGETLRYQYKLDGVDADWSEPTTLRTVSLNLSPGSYRFLVRAVNAEGLASKNPALVSFNIARPVWQRWWFLLMAALLLGLSAYALYRYRVAQLLKLERVRTRIATDLHDDIGASLSQIAILSEVVSQRVDHDDRPVTEPLSLIAGTSREMLDAMSDIVWAINPKRDQLSDLSQRMRRFASDLLSARDIRFRFHAPEAEKNIRLGVDLRREVYLIFKETVNNMVKHSFCTEADLSFQIEGNWLTVKVSDNGRGFDVQAASNGNHSGMGGHGLASMRKRAEALGGTYLIESKKGQGTTVTLRVPLSGHGGKTGVWKRLLPK